MKFLYACIYLAALGIIFFFLGRAMARHTFSYEKGLFKVFKFEKEGCIYKKLGVHKWQSRVPDMSRICKKLMPEKKMQGRPDRKGVALMINETCVAELIHLMLIIFALPLLFILPGAGGWAVFIIYALGNLPDIIIQRYNRPRFIKLYKLCRE